MQTHDPGKDKRKLGPEGADERVADQDREIRQPGARRRMISW